MEEKSFISVTESKILSSEQSTLVFYGLPKIKKQLINFIYYARFVAVINVALQNFLRV